MATEEQKIARVIDLARENIKRGVIREPRVYFDNSITMPDSTTQFVTADPDVFKNGEEYPVRIHALLAAVMPDNSTDERNIQRVGMRMMMHDHYYMQREFIPLPLWHNRVIAAPSLIQFGMSSWKLHTPFVFSSRDSMDVRSQLFAAPTNQRTNTFAMTGVGMDSMRPYFKADERDFTAADAPAPMNPENLRNDGDEPILITDLVFHCSAGDQSNNPQGDIRQADFSVRQVGNGTQAQWMNGPVGSDDLCPAVLLGRTTGRAIVHDFPGEGLLWEPGEGLRVELASLNSNVSSTTVVGVAILGTIEVR